MKGKLVKSLPLALALLSLALIAAGAGARASGSDEWTSARTRHFLVVGNAGAGEVRRVALRLEQFREIFSRLLDVNYSDPNSPPVVIAFKDDASYKPFKPLYRGRAADVAGHFQSGPYTDYLTLSLDQRRKGAPHFVVLHEYVHLLVKNSFGDAPLWFNEGLAEYYSTLRASDNGRKVTLGRAVAGHLQTLRRAELLPLQTLFAVGRESAHYNEQGQRGVFYAESWALVHYLLTAEGGRRRAQLPRYLQLLASGTNAADAFREAFKTNQETLEQELRAYVREGFYAEQVVTFEKGFEEDSAEVESARVSEAEARAVLGDLLLHSERLEEAEGHLRRSLALDPTLARAHASLGLLRLKQGRREEAEESLHRATEADPRDYLARYFHAYALSREGADAHQWVTDYQPERAELMRAELRKAIELAPRFVESYRLLAFVNLVRDERLDEAAALLRHALTLAPKRHELSITLAQVYLRREEFEEARRVLAPLADASAAPRPRAPHLAAQARALLESIPRREELIARRRSEVGATSVGDSATLSPPQPCDMAYTGPQHKRLRFEGEQRCGMLTSVECEEDDAVTLLVSTAAGTLRLRSDALNRIRFVTYTAEVKTGPITCGPRQPANPVLVTFRSFRNLLPKADGEALAVEFVPKEWHAGN